MLLSVSPVKVKSFLHLAPSKLPLTLLLWAWLETQSWLHGVWAYLASQAKFSPVSERYQTLNTGWYELSTHCAVIKQLVRAHMSCWWGKLEYRSTDGYVLNLPTPRCARMSQFPRGKSSEGRGCPAVWASAMSLRKHCTSPDRLGLIANLLCSQCSGRRQLKGLAL